MAEDDVFGGKGSPSSLGFLRDFMSFRVCSIDLKSLLLALGTGGKLANSEELNK